MAKKAGVFDYFVPLSSGRRAPSIDRSCRACGCTENRACQPTPCYWVEEGLCSACAPEVLVGRIAQIEAAIVKLQKAIFPLMPVLTAELRAHERDRASRMMSRNTGI